jgi:ABC-type multidrug transport system fused ATPase/permease subunit
MNDSQRQLDMGMYGVFSFLGPVAIVAVLIILLNVIGVSILAGYAVMALFLPLQRFVATAMGRIRRTTVPLTSARTSAMNEVLNGIKLIKLYAWERPFANIICEQRRLEVESLLRAAWAYTVQTTLSWVMPVMITFATFAVYAAVESEPLRSNQAFTTVALMMMLRFAFQNMPNSIRYITEGVVALRRIQKFLEKDEVCADDLPVDLNGAIPPPPPPPPPPAHLCPCASLRIATLMVLQTQLPWRRGCT